MQCLNCGFENLPGLNDCGRCGSSLSMGEVAIEPGRASALRLRTRFSQVGNILSSGLHRLGTIRLLRLVPRPQNPLLWSAVTRTIVPGLGHIHLRHRATGWIMLGGWLTCLLIALFTLPSTATYWLFSGAIVIHTSAFISLFAQDLSYERMLVRALFGALLFIGLRTGVYMPLAGLAGRAYTTMVIPDNFTPGPLLQSGDGILYEGAWNRPESYSRGDLVVYEIPHTYGAGYYSQAGLGIDRVVAIPGDEVRIEAGRLYVNGAIPSDDFSPLGGIPILTDISFTVRPHQYLIIPSRFNIHGPRDIQQEFYSQIIHVNEASILGRVRMILKPWSRWGPVE